MHLLRTFAWYPPSQRLFGCLSRPLGSAIQRIPLMSKVLPPTRCRLPHCLPFEGEVSGLLTHRADVGTSLSSVANRGILPRGATPCSGGAGNSECAVVGELFSLTAKADRFARISERDTAFRRSLGRPGPERGPVDGRRGVYAPICRERGSGPGVSLGGSEIGA